MSQEDRINYHQKKSNQEKKLHEEKKESEYNGEDDEEKENPVKTLHNEAQLLESDYILLSEPVELMQVSPISFADSTEVTNHIVVCGLHPSIYYFLLPLRANYLKEYQYVVILSPEKPSDIWEFISRFPKIMHIKGSPLLREDLIRANINFADKAVILGQDMENTAQSGILDGMLDAESIFIYKAIKKCKKNVQIMVELGDL